MESVSQVARSLSFGVSEHAFRFRQAHRPLILIRFASYNVWFQITFGFRFADYPLSFNFSYFVVSSVIQWWNESVTLVPNLQRRPLWRLESTSQITCTWQNSKTVPGLVLASSRCRIFLFTLPLKFFTTRRRFANNQFSKSKYSILCLISNFLHSRSKAWRHFADRTAAFVASVGRRTWSACSAQPTEFHSRWGPYFLL